MWASQTQYLLLYIDFLDEKDVSLPNFLNIE